MEGQSVPIIIIIIIIIIYNEFIYDDDTFGWVITYTTFIALNTYIYYVKII